MKSSVQSTNILSNNSEEIKKAQITKSLSSKFFGRLYVAILVSNDVLMTLLAFRLAYFVRFETSFSFFRLDVEPSKPYYFGISLLIAAVWLIIFTSVGLYNRQNLLGGTDEYAFVARATTFGFLVLIIFGFLEPAFIIARGWLITAWPRPAQPLVR